MSTDRFKWKRQIIAHKSASDGTILISPETDSAYFAFPYSSFGRYNLKEERGNKTYWGMSVKYRIQSQSLMTTDEISSSLLKHFLNIITK